MKIKEDKCIGCGKCAITCPVNAVTIIEGKASIDKLRCVECSTCYRSAQCPAGAIRPERLKWPRLVRNPFSDVISTHKLTGVPGRGTEEMKTNDVTGRFGRGEVGFSIEIGRPGMGTRLENVELFTTRLANIGVEYEPESPLTALLAGDGGNLQEDVKQEHVLSAIIEFKTVEANISSVLDVISEVDKIIDTTFTVGMIEYTGASSEGRLIDRATSLGFSPRPNAKVNAGLGRPEPEGKEETA